MANVYDIIIRPIITERSMVDVANKKYVFEVAKDAGKVEIKKAVETAFGVKVAKVNTLNVSGKAKRLGAGRPGQDPQLEEGLSCSSLKIPRPSSCSRAWCKGGKV